MVGHFLRLSEFLFHSPFLHLSLSLPSLPPSLPFLSLCCPQQRHDQVLATQLAQEQVEVALRNEEAMAKEMEAARMKKRQKESILEDLVRIPLRWGYHYAVFFVVVVVVCFSIGPDVFQSLSQPGAGQSRGCIIGQGERGGVTAGSNS